MHGDKKMIVENIGKDSNALKFATACMSSYEQEVA